MIYIFQACQNVCSLPGLACKGCADLCGKMNCNWLKDLCSGCGNCVVQFHTKPLSSFVMISFILSGVVGFCGYQTLEKDCELKDSSYTLKTFCYIALACAVVNIVFAIYFQFAVWKHIQYLIGEDFKTNRNNEATVELEEVKASWREKAGQFTGQAQQLVQGAQGGTNEAKEERDAEAMAIKHKIKADTVQDGFKTTFMQDFGVLIFFMASLAMVVLSYMTKSSFDEATCKASEYEGWLCWATYGFFTIPATYTFLWYCCGKTCCAKACPIDQYTLEQIQNEQIQNGPHAAE